MAKVTGLFHIGIFVKDVKKSAQWYEEFLGFKTTWECSFVEGNEYTIAIIENGSCVIELVQSPGFGKLGDGVTDHVALAVDDLEGMIKQLAAKGIKFETAEPVFKANVLKNGTKWIFFRGPDNEHIELSQAL
ncbi:hypothetical protein FACS189468_4780 [Spirochaetia bacterium]|nr:hypothetical protein FACS189468_4780 [Spirochaetia bacterium]